MKKSVFDYDVAVIGGGSAGYAAARVAAGAGLKTAVVEGGKEVGGLCILRGCMPSKTLLYSAEVLHHARMGKTWGLRIPKAGFDFKSVMARKNLMIKGFADYRRGQLEKGKFTFFRALGRFLDPHTLALESLGQPVPKKITAKYFMISTGSVVAQSPLPELEKVGYWTSDDALSLKKLPRSLIVLGGGPTALELAQFFSRMDVKVTVIQRSAHVLHSGDTDVSVAVETALRREGITIFTDTQLTGVFRAGKQKGIEFKTGGKIKRVKADEILFCLGRNPNTASLGLEQAGVSTERGRIITNAEMQTSASHIFAGGDCTGPHEIVHVGVEQGEIAAHNITQPRKKKKIDYRLLISVTFTEPQVATVGLTEKEAVAKKNPFITAQYPFNDHGKSMIMEANDGFVKLLANPKTGEIIGGACVGPMGGDLIHEIVAAMYKRMTVQELSVMPHYHPTLAEIWTYPAGDLAEMVA